MKRHGATIALLSAIVKRLKPGVSRLGDLSRSIVVFAHNIGNREIENFATLKTKMFSMVQPRTCETKTFRQRNFSSEIFRFASEILTSRATKIFAQPMAQALRFRRTRPGLDPGIDPPNQG
jgi:hypothetical protein